MNITSAKYVLSPITNENDCIIAVINNETWSVPIIVGNTHFDEIMRQVNAGTLTIEDAD